METADILRLKSKAAVGSLIDEKYAADQERFLIDLSRLLNRQLQVDLNEASKVVAVLEVIEPTVSERLRPRLEAMRARHAHFTGDHARAKRLYERAIDAASQHREFRTAAQMRQGLMDVLMYLGKYSQAVTTGRKALRYFRRKSLKPDEGRLLTNLGNVYHRQDRNREALQYYDKAAAIFEETGGVPLAIVRFNQANIHSNLNQLDVARELYSDAARIYKKAGLQLLQTKAEYSLAYLEFLGDHYSRALQLLELAGQQFEKLADDRAAAVTLLDLAEINLYLNQLGTTIYLARQLTERFGELGMRYEQGKAHLFAALALARLGDSEPAVAELANAQELFEAEGNREWLAMVDYALGRVRMVEGDHAAAVECADRAVAAFSRLGDDRRQIDARILAAEASLNAGDTAAASRRLRTLESRRGALRSQQFLLADLAGRIQTARGRADLALSEYEGAIEIADSLLAGLYPDEIRFFFALDKLPTFARAAEAALEVGHIDRSLRHRLGALARINRRRPDREYPDQPIPKELAAARDRLRTTLRRLERMPETGHRGITSSAATVEQRLWRVEQKIRAWAKPEAASELKETDIPDVARLRRGEYLMHPVATRGRIGWYIATREGGTRFVGLSVSSDQIESMVRHLQFVMEQPLLTGGSIEATARAAGGYLESLYGQLLRPLKQLEPGSRLIIIPDGLFGQIPWSILMDHGQMLFDKYDVQILTSPADLAVSRSLPRFNGGSVFSVSGPDLPQVDSEAAEIGSLYDSARMYRDDLATVDSFKQQLGRRRGFVHLAAHASCSGENPLFSRVLLADGPLFPFDLFESGVAVPLVTLSGCQTAAPGLYYGSSFSLARAFLQAGGRFVLASLWSVSDRLSRIFMVEFYRRMKSGQNIFEAYRGAVRHLSSATANPAALGAFVLLGR